MEKNDSHRKQRGKGYQKLSVFPKLKRDATWFPNDR